MWRPLFLLAALPLAAAAAVIDFETLTDLEAVTSQYPGLTFGSARVLTAGLSLNEFEFPPESGLNVVFDDGGPLTATFSTPVNGVSAVFTYSVPLIMRAFDVFENPVASSATIFSSNMGISGDPGSAPNENLSVAYAAGIHRVSITGAALGGSFTMDDFAFESGASQAVPEPSLSWLVTIVSAAVMLAARRAKATDGPPGKTSQFRGRSMLSLRLLTVVGGPTALLAVYLAAAPTVGVPAMNPPVVTITVPTAVTITANIPDPSLIAGSVNLLRVPTSGTPTVLGVMRDDGTNGDAQAGDKTFSVRVTFAEAATGSVRLRVSAAFRGVLQRVTAEISLAVQPQPSRLLAGAPGEPVEARIPDIPFPDGDPAEFIFADDLGTPISVRTLLIQFQAGVTVGQANQLLLSVGASVAGGDLDLGWLLVRLVTPRTPRGIIELARTLRSGGLLLSAQYDVPSSGPDRLPGPSGDSHYNWGDTSGTWNLEAVKAPNLWNLLDDVARNNVFIPVGVFDSFFTFHDDLVGKLPVPPLTPIIPQEHHGTSVAGVITAWYHNYHAVAGIAPSSIIVPHQVRAASWSGELWEFKKWLEETPDIQIVNISRGIRAETPRVAAGFKQGDREEAQQVINGLGDKFADIMTFFSRQERELLVFASAGQQRKMAPSFFPVFQPADPEPVPSMWNSPWCNASARHATLNLVVCVEAVTNAPGYPRAAFSNSCPPEDPADVLATRCLAAPGEGVGVLALIGMQTSNGTSFSAPLVAGTAAFLKDYLNLSVRTIYKYLKRYSRSQEYDEGGNPIPRARMLDASFALLGHDLDLGSHGIQSRLVDVDDGTADGNTRRDRSDQDDDGNTTEIHPTDVKDAHGIETQDHRRGSTGIDMADFRAFRDALLQAQIKEPDFIGKVGLDGGDLHFKKDLNFDGCVGIAVPNPPHPVVEGLSRIPVAEPGKCTTLWPQTEFLYSRYDFNGDGRLNGFEVDPKALAVAPFKIDPATKCVGLNNPAGCLRDIDVLADRRFWSGQTSNEHVKVAPPADVAPALEPCSPQAQPHWLPTTDLYADRNNDGIIDYLRSADLHFILGPDPAYLQVALRILIKRPGDANFSLFKCMVQNGPIAKTRTMVTVPLLTPDIQVVFTALGGPLFPKFETVTLEGLKWGQDVTLIWPGTTTPMAIVP